MKERATRLEHTIVVEPVTKERMKELMDVIREGKKLHPNSEEFCVDVPGPLTPIESQRVLNSLGGNHELGLYYVGIFSEKTLSDGKVVTKIKLAQRKKNEGMNKTKSTRRR
jgi:hypothetical protein